MSTADKLKQLKLSAMHISHESLQKLSFSEQMEFRAWGWPTIMPDILTHGTSFATPDLTDESVKAQVQNMPRDLAAVVRYAHDHGFTSIEFGFDLPEIKDLPLY